MCHHELWPTFSGPSLLFSQQLLRPYWRKILPEKNIIAIFRFVLLKFYFSRLLSLLSPPKKSGGDIGMVSVCVSVCHCICPSFRGFQPFLAATKQLNEWYFPSVCLSVTPFWLCSHHRIIMKFSGVITNDRSDVHAKGQGQTSKVKVTEVNTQLSRFRTVTPVWIHIW